MKSNFFAKTGKMALGSRLRMLTTKVTDDAAEIYALYNVELAPKWFPVFYVLSERNEVTITEIAREIGHSQPSVSKIVKEMGAAGLVQGNGKSVDKRRNVVVLTDKGLNIAHGIQEQYQDVEASVENMINEATYNLWEALEEWEYLLEQKSLYRRVQEQKKLRESQQVQIIDYKNKYQAAFKILNEEWITTYFEMEEADYKVLDNPKKYILNKGGQIVVALYKNEAVGVCALLPRDDPEYPYELSKMGVRQDMRGKNIGWLLGKAIIEKAKTLGVATLYLESNTILKPAI
ncbi:MAG: GNAT family N-acetyltransferase, partial [Bacteroidota bacterium]